MADQKPRIVTYRPGGVGFSSTLRKTVREGSWLTAFEDGILSTCSQILDRQDIEIKPFGTFLTLINNMAGQLQGRRLTQPQLVSLIMRACGELEPHSFFAHVKNQPGAARCIAQAITTLHHHNVDLPSVPIEIPEEQGLLHQKMSELLLINQKVYDYAEEINHEFGADKASRCLNLPENPTLTFNHLVLIAPTEENPLYQQFINWIATCGVEVDILAEDHPNQYLLSEPKKLSQTFGKYADQTTQPKCWTDCLFTPETNTDGPSQKLIKAHDPLTEVEWVLRECSRLIQQGVSPEKIGIWVRSTDLYPQLILSSSKRLGVPIKANFSLPLSASGFVQFTLQTLKILAGSDVRRLLSLTQRSYINLTTEEIQLLKDITQDSYQEDNPWLALEESLKAESKLEDIQALVKWRNTFGNVPKNLVQWQNCFRNLWNDTTILDEIVAQDETSMKREQNAQTVMQRSLCDASLMMEDNLQLNFSQFVHLVENTWRTETSVWSERKNGVKLCTTTAQLKDFEYLFAMGMIEGTIPRKRNEDTVLHDEELEVINNKLKLEYPIPDSNRKITQERDEFARICGSAKECIIFSFATTTDDRLNIPAYYLEEAHRASGGKLQGIDDKIKSPFASINESLSHYDLTIAQGLALENKVVPVAPHFDLDTSHQMVRLSEEDALTFKEIVDAQVCPFKSTMKNRLHLKPRSDRSSLLQFLSLPADIGISKIKNLEEARKALSKKASEVLDALSPSLEEWEYVLLERGVSRLINEWIELENQLRTHWNLDRWDPKTNIFFGEGNTRDKLNLNTNESVQLKGKYDAFGLMEMGWPPGNKNNPNAEKRKFLIARTSLPAKLNTHNKNDEEDKKEVLYHLFALSTIAKKEQANPIFIVTTLDQSAQQFAGQSHGTTQKRKFEDLELVTFVSQESSLTSQYSEYREEMLQAVSQILKGKIEPHPGLHCSKCELGALCRSHNEYGEQNLSFEVED